MVNWYGIEWVSMGWDGEVWYGLGCSVLDGVRCGGEIPLGGTRVELG